MLCKLTYGLTADGSAVHISQAARGAECGCICPGCGKPLIARKGDKTLHHFAHAEGGDCEYGFINSLYYALKSAADRLGFIALPPYIKNRSLTDDGSGRHILIKRTRVKIDRTEFTRKHGRQITGLLLWCSGRPLHLRILAGFSEPRAGLDAIKQTGLPVAEINLSADESLNDELAEEYIGTQAKNKYWIYNEQAERRWDNTLKQCRRYAVKGSGKNIYTQSCPVPSHRHDSMNCLIRTECARCPFFFGLYGYEETSHIMCGRETLVSCPEDAALSLAERRAKYSRKQ